MAPVENLNAYSIVKGEGSAVKFKTVKTKAIKLEVVLHDEKQRVYMNGK